MGGWDFFAAGAMPLHFPRAGLLLWFPPRVSRDLFRTFRNKIWSEKKELPIATFSCCWRVVNRRYFGNSILLVLWAEVVAFAFWLAAASFLFSDSSFGDLSPGRINKKALIRNGFWLVFYVKATSLFFKFISPNWNLLKNYWWFGISPEGIGSMGWFLNFLMHCSSPNLLLSPQKMTGYDSRNTDS